MLTYDGGTTKAQSGHDFQDMLDSVNGGIERQVP